jgi:phospholipase/carboxylesterase
MSDRSLVLVAHGAADNVIPADLLERTWQYLHDGSGATVVGVRDPGGHGISAAVLAKLNDWLSTVLVPEADRKLIRRSRQ